MGLRSTSDNPALDAFQARFTHSPDINTLTPFGFFEAGWRAGGGDSSDAEIIEVLLPDQEQKREIREIRASVEALLVLNQDQRAEVERLQEELWRAVELNERSTRIHQLALAEARDEAERLRAAVVEIGAAHVAAQAEVERRSEQHEIDNGVQEKLYEERDDALHQAERLAHEVERLQRENGALAHTYALAEEKLRERTEQLNRADANIERLRGWAKAESEHWDERNADRYWQMQRVLRELGLIVVSDAWQT